MPGIDGNDDVTFRLTEVGNVLDLRLLLAGSGEQIDHEAVSVFTGAVVSRR